MANAPVVSIVGRPNVGKSSLFNRVIGKRIAVVDDFPGVTRDRNYIPANWSGQDFILVDTGGLIPNVHESIPEEIHEQVRIAVQESVVVIFLVDAQTGPTDLDLLAAKLLRRSASNKIILAVNKSESLATSYDIDTYRSLGLGEPFPISAIHGKGVADLLDKIVKKINESGKVKSKPEDTVVLKMAVVGRPNAGKSSLVNKLLREKRMIVDEVAGTTRDAIDSRMIFDDKPIVLIDTAGLRKKSHVKMDLEYYSNLRAINSIERSDVCALIIDATQELGIQDLRIIRKIIELRKGIVIAWNKWDIKEKDHKTFDVLVADVKHEFMELRPLPMVAISALTGRRVHGLVEVALKIKERMTQRLPAKDFENTLFEWVKHHPHPNMPGKEVRFLGAKQVTATFPLFRCFVTNPESVTLAYLRYLTNKMYEEYDFEGCPVVIEFRSGARPRSHTTHKITYIQHGQEK